MVLNTHDIAQDGRFTIKLDQTNIEVRVSIIPGNYGESIVMRILNPKAIALKLEDMGFREDIYQLLEKEIRKPHGIIITTGPTGSGKTTTLYAFLKKITSSKTKIITLEDPIEYHLPGIVQTQVEAKQGYTFANGLRAILRQDPDVILVGEIRDAETAEIAIQSAQTGHLVFSTLHTNDAAGAIPRFILLNVKPPLLADTLNLIMAQRLVRRLCLNCKKEDRPTAEEMKKIKPEQRIEAMLKTGITIIAREDKGLYAGNNEWKKIPKELKPLYEKGNISHGISEGYFLKEKVA